MTVGDLWLTVFIAASQIRKLASEDGKSEPIYYQIEFGPDLSICSGQTRSVNVCLAIYILLVCIYCTWLLTASAWLYWFSCLLQL